MDDQSNRDTATEPQRQSLSFSDDVPCGTLLRWRAPIVSWCPTAMSGLAPGWQHPRLWRIAQQSLPFQGRRGVFSSSGPWLGRCSGHVCLFCELLERWDKMKIGLVKKKTFSGSVKDFFLHFYHFHDNFFFKS